VGSLRACAGILDVLENNCRYRNLSPYCEPQLGKRNLYRSLGGDSIGNEISARLWVLNFSDGEHSLLDIAERSGIPFAAISDAAELLRQNGLLALVPEDSAGANIPTQGPETGRLSALRIQCESNVAALD